MTRQMGLLEDGWLDGLAPDPADVKAAQMWARWRRFHADRPDVMAELVGMVREVKARHPEGRAVSVRDLFGALRLDRLRRGSGEGLVLNNTWAAFYARAIVARHPDLAGWIGTRESAADRNAA